MFPILNLRMYVENVKKNIKIFSDAGIRTGIARLQAFDKLTCILPLRYKRFTYITVVILIYKFKFPGKCKEH